MLEALKSVYSNVSSCVKIGLNNDLTEWFKVGTGLRQGCLLSPLLFNIYINDSAMQIKEKCHGVKLGDGEKVCVLIYADDMVLISETEKDLQDMLDILHEWCTTWDVLVNLDKSKIVHYRSAKTAETLYNFTFSGKSMDKVDRYKYLGLILHYKLDFSVTAQAVAKSATRALGLLIAKAKAFGGFTYNCMTKLYESMVMSIIRYGAAVWGDKEFSCINAVHNRMCRYYLGVNKFTPNAAIQGDMGVRVPWQHQKLEIARQWCRLVNMSDSRVNKKIFKWANGFTCKNWTSRAKNFFNLCQRDVYTAVNNIDKKDFMDDMHECIEKIFVEKWLAIVNKVESRKKNGKNKLRTYCTLKSTFCSEKYVYNILPKSHRSALAQFRSGTAPIRLETGRYEGLPVEERICFVCKNCVESELHVLIECPLYNEIRSLLFSKLQMHYRNFYDFSKKEQMKCILACEDDVLVKECAKACHDILSLRRTQLYV